MNKAIIHGIIARNPQIREFSANGKNMKGLSFKVAVNSSRKGKEGTYETDFINVSHVLPGESRLPEYLKKGTSVILTGAVHPRSYKNNAGQTVYTTVIEVDRGGLELIGSGSGVNIAALSGRLVKDAEVRSSGEYDIINLTVAAQRPFKNKGGEYDTDFIPVSYARKDIGRLPEYLKKGTEISVAGSCHAGSFKKDDAWKEFFSVNASKICLANRKKEDDDGGISIHDNMEYPSPNDPEDEDDGELPF